MEPVSTSQSRHSRRGGNPDTEPRTVRKFLPRSRHPQRINGEKLFLSPLEGNWNPILETEMVAGNVLTQGAHPGTGTRPHGPNRFYIDPPKDGHQVFEATKNPRFLDKVLSRLPSVSGKPFGFL